MESKDDPSEVAERRGCISAVFKRAFHIPCRFVCMGVLLLQSCLLDYYLVFYNSSVWCLWAIPDLLVAAVFLASLILSYRSLSLNAGQEGHREDGSKRDRLQRTGGELPLGYMAWFIYSLVLSAKIGLIFGDSLYIVEKITHEALLDGSVLRTALSMSSIIFFTLIVTHSDAPAKSERQAFMESLMGSVAIDLLDATQFLDVLYLYDSHVILSYGLHTAVVAVACIVFILPTVLLLGLSRSRFGRCDTWLKRLRYLHRVVHFLVVNIPMLVIRTVIWHVHKKEASVFIIKNVLGIGIAVNEIFSKLADLVGASSSSIARGGEQHEMVPIGPSSLRDQESKLDDVHAKQDKAIESSEITPI